MAKLPDSVRAQALKAVESVQQLGIRAETVEQAPVFNAPTPEPSSTVAQMPQDAKREAVATMDTVREQVTVDSRFDGTSTPSQSFTDPEKGQRTADSINQMQHSGYSPNQIQREMTKDSPSPSSGYE